MSRMRQLLVVLLAFTVARAQQPEQLHIALGDDPSQMLVTWTTFTPASAPVIEWRKAPASGFPYIQAPDDIDAFDYNGTVRFIHHALIKGLAPGDQIVYKVGSTHNGPWSQTYNFTVIDPSKPLRACIFGDLGLEHGYSVDGLLAAAAIDSFDVIFHLGDIAYSLHDNNGTVGDQFLNEIEPIIATVPYFVIAGNHEDDGRNFSNFQRRFRMPTQGRNDNHYYSYDFAFIHFVALSTEYYEFTDTYGTENANVQFRWLQHDLQVANQQRSQRPWIVTLQHRPFYCSNKGSSECTEYQNEVIRSGDKNLPGLEALYLEAGIDLGVWGHEHTYERFWPIANRTFYTNGTQDPYYNAPAPTYITSGAAGCHSFPGTFKKNPAPWSAIRSLEYGWTVLTVHNATHIELRQVGPGAPRGPTVDNFWISKDPGHIPRQEPRRKTGYWPDEEWPMGAQCSELCTSE